MKEEAVLIGLHHTALSDRQSSPSRSSSLLTLRFGTTKVPPYPCPTVPEPCPTVPLILSQWGAATAVASAVNTPHRFAAWIQVLSLTLVPEPCLTGGALYNILDKRVAKCTDLFSSTLSVVIHIFPFLLRPHGILNAKTRVFVMALHVLKAFPS